MKKALVLASLLLWACGATEPPPEPVSTVSIPAVKSQPKPLPVVIQKPPAAVNWLAFDEKNIRNAALKDQIVLVYLYADWCPYCYLMDQQLFKNKAVIQLVNDNFTTIKVNGEERPEIVNMLLDGQTSYPSVVFILTNENYDLMRLGGFHGYVEPEQFAIMAQQILKSKILTIEVEVETKSDEQP